MPQQGFITVKESDGTSYKMPWAQSRDPTDDEIDSFLASQKKTIFGDIVSGKIKNYPFKDIARNFGEILTTSYLPSIQAPDKIRPQLPPSPLYGSTSPQDVDIPNEPDFPTARLGRYGYSRLIQPAVSPIGIAAAPFLGTKPVQLGFGALGAVSLPGAVKEAVREPSFESIADVGLNSLMALGGGVVARRTLREMRRPANVKRIVKEATARSLSEPQPVESVSKIEPQQVSEKPLTKTDILNADIVKQAVEARPNLRLIDPNLQEVDLINPNQQTSKKLYDQGYRPVKVNEDKSIRFRKLQEVESIIPKKEPIQEEEMRIPGSKPGFTKDLPNIAVGGASEQVVKTLGTSLYSNRGPVSVTKELLQNAFDEHNISKTIKPIRVLFNASDKNPATNSAANSITVRDFGRGLTSDQLFNEFTNLGESGKRGEFGAFGGFGFAKAAPLLGGEYAKIVSVVNENGRRIQYSFEGTPEQLANQKVGVPVERLVVDNNVPTGLKITTYFGNDENLYSAINLTDNMVKNSASINSNVIRGKNYIPSPSGSAEKFIEGGPGFEFAAEQLTKGKSLPLRDTIKIPGSEISIHYEEPTAGSEASTYRLHYQNKGLYQETTIGGYGLKSIPNVPEDIVANIIATVEEGAEGYPFTANREQLNSKVVKAISDWIEINIKSGAEKKRVVGLQKMYDNIGVLASTLGGESFHFIDSGNKFNFDEIAKFENSPIFRKGMNTVKNVHERLIKIADDLEWGIKPSQRLKKFGLLFQEPNIDPKIGTTLGIHIPRANDPNDSAILINLMEHFNQSIAKSKDPLDRFATALLTTLTHEDAHIPGGGHDTGHSYRHADFLSTIGGKTTIRILDELANAFGDKNGQIDPEILELLQIYNDSRRRTTRGDDALIRTGVNIKGPSNTRKGTKGSDEGITNSKDEIRSIRKKLLELPKDESGLFDVDKIIEIGGKIIKKTGRAILNPGETALELGSLSKSLMSGPDLSAPRQGFPLIGTPEYWKAFGNKMFMAAGSEKGYRQVESEIAQLSTQKPNIRVGRQRKSLAEISGLKLSSLDTELINREEQIMSRLPEKINIAPWTEGGIHPYRASNRGFTGSLNYLRATRFEKLVRLAVKSDLDISDRRVTKAIANFVNHATGRGSLGDFEGAAKFLSTVGFSPRLLKSRFHFFNPKNYVLEKNPIVRKEMWKSLGAMTGSIIIINELAHFGGAETTSDPTNANFGKVKIGNTRIDFSGGMLPIVRLLAQLSTGKLTSSTTGRVYDLGSKKYGAVGYYEVVRNFLETKESPLASFVGDWLKGEDVVGKPFNYKDAIVKRFISLAAQDIYEILKENPNLILMAVPSIFGGSTQTYGPRPPQRSPYSVPRF